MFNILIVDDDKNNRFSIRSLIDELDVGVFEAQNGETALIQLMEKKVDLIILDVQLPDYNGFQLAKMIKSRKSTSEIPILLTTAVFKAQVFVEQGFEAGAIDYVLKPISGKVLISKVKYYLKLYYERINLINQVNMYKLMIHKLNDESNILIRIYEGEKELLNENFESIIDNLTVQEEKIDEIVKDVYSKGIDYYEVISDGDYSVKYEAISFVEENHKKILLICRPIL